MPCGHVALQLGWQDHGRRFCIERQHDLHRGRGRVPDPRTRQFYLAKNRLVPPYVGHGAANRTGGDMPDHRMYGNRLGIG